VDLGFLRSLYENPRDEPGDGYVSVYLDTSPATEAAATEVGLRWRAAREQLAAAGADEATLAAAGRVVTQRTHPFRARVVFARAGAVRLSGILLDPPALGEISSYAPLPNVVPWLAQRPPRFAHVRVAADRAGGRVLAVSGAGAAGSGLAATGETGDIDTTTEMVGLTEVAGESWPVHKASVGGWSQPRLQRSTEEAWAETAKRIAEAVTVAADQVKAQFVVAGGDVRERTMVVDHLPKALRDNVVIVDREVELDAPAFDEATWAEASWRAALESRARLDEFNERMGKPPQERRAVEGLGETLTALRDGLVSDLLLVADDPAWSSATAWIGPGPAQAATEGDQLTELGVTGPVTDRADAALVRAATGTGAELHFLPADLGAGPEGDEVARPRGGVAALLRAPSAALA
jgi:hypothetical protein